MSTESARTGGELVVDALRADGVRVVFGVLSAHNLPIFDALAREGTIRVVPARGEQGAAGMADAYARATGRLGVVVTSTAGGAANASGALLEAFEASIPLLHVTGQVESPYIDTDKALLHGHARQLSMLASVSKAARRAARTEDIPGVMAEAIELARAGRPGPVSVEIPIDQQVRSVPALAARFARAGPPVPDTAAIARAALLLRGARRPLIWAGGGAARGGDEITLTGLAERLGAGVITTAAGRGAIAEDHPLCIGNFAAEDSVIALVKESDVVLAVGTRFRGNETRSWTIPMPAHLIRVDRAPEMIERDFPVEVGIVSDAAAALCALHDAIGGGGLAEPGWLGAIETARASARARWRAMLGPQERILDALRAALPDDAIVVRDVTVPASTWGARLLEARLPRTALHSATLAIGLGLPMGIGAAVGRPDRRVVVLAGDGGLSLAVGELGTAIQERCDLLVVLFNDRGYGILRNMQDAWFDRRRSGSELGMPDFTALARSYGCWAERAESGAAFERRLGEALGRSGVRLIEVDLDALGPMAQPFTGIVRLA